MDATGTTAYCYAAGGQLWTEDGPWSSDTVTNTYNNRLRTALSLAQPTGSWTNAFGYDPAKRLTNVTSQAGSFAYTLGGASYASPLIKKLSLPNTSYITNTYDSVARLTGTWLKNSTNGTLNSHQYTYNSGNQRTQQVFNVGSTYNYTYDPIGQLTVGDSATASEDRSYKYDAAWNLNYRTNNGVLNTFSVDQKNQLTYPHYYDGNGNLTQDQAAGPDRFYTYDDENQLVEIEREEVWRAELIYDGRGRLRVRKEYDFTDHWNLTSETRYVYDGMRVIQERSGSDTPEVSYTRGTDLSGSVEGAGGIGGLLARSDGYWSGNWTNHNYYHADGNGNITYLVNSSEGLAAKYRYDPYGNLISSSGTLAGANVYRFSSKEIHVDSGLYYYGYRWYDPNLQRWLNRDLIAERGGINLYGFLKNRPVFGLDPFGLGFYPGPLTVGLPPGSEPPWDPLPLPPFSWDPPPPSSKPPPIKPPNPDLPFCLQPPAEPPLHFPGLPPNVTIGAHGEPGPGYGNTTIFITITIGPPKPEPPTGPPWPPESRPPAWPPPILRPTWPPPR